MLSPGVRAISKHTVVLICIRALRRAEENHIRMDSMVAGRCAPAQRKHFILSDFWCVSRVSLQSTYHTVCAHPIPRSLSASGLILLSLACVHFWLMRKLSRCSAHRPSKRHMYALYWFHLHRAPTPTPRANASCVVVVYLRMHKQRALAITIS